MVGVDRLREIAESDYGAVVVWTDGGWVAALIRELVRDEEPMEIEPGEWDDAIVMMDVYAPMGHGYAHLMAESEDGEWGDVVWESFEYDENGYSEVVGRADVRDVVGVARGVVDDERAAVLEEMVAAVEASPSTTTLERAIFVSSVIRAAARSGWGEVWDEYESEESESSIGGFAAWLNSPRLRELLDDQGQQMWPLWSGIWDVSDRVLQRCMRAVEYFFAREWGVEVGSTHVDEDEEASEEPAGGGGEDGDDSGDVEVSFEPASSDDGIDDEPLTTTKIEQISEGDRFRVITDSKNALAVAREDPDVAEAEDGGRIINVRINFLHTKRNRNKMSTLSRDVPGPLMLGEEDLSPVDELILDV